MKKASVLLLIIPFLAIAQIKKTTKIPLKLPVKTTLASPVLSNLDIANGLKEALNKGITDQVSKLAIENGFNANAAVKILYPEEFVLVESRLRKFGLGSLADEGVTLMNRAAEKAVKEATPIFVNAVKNMSFTDAKTILLGSENAATTFLEKGTSTDLKAKFTPIVTQSISDVGADIVWKKMTDTYNKIPFITKINPNLNEYVTVKTMEGVFKMIAVEEKNIRQNSAFRNTDLLKKVFSLQDIAGIK